jgi:chromosomal replication initiator protein
VSAIYSPEEAVFDAAPVLLSLWRGEIRPKHQIPQMRTIAAAVAERHGLTVSDLCGPSSACRVSRARHEAMWEIRRRTAKSLPVMGRFFNRHHTTILYGIRAFERSRADFV